MRSSHARAPDEKGVILTYLNVLISPARISGCTKGAEGVSSAQRGHGSHPGPVHGGIFTLAPGTSRDDGDLLNGRGLEEREGKRERRRGDGKVKKQAHALFSRGRG